MNQQPIRSIQKRNQLSSQEKEDLLKLVHTCCLHEGLRISCPLEPNSFYYLCYQEQNTSRLLISAAAVLPYDDSLAECIGFTHPDFRRQGCFSALLDEILADFQEMDLLFPLSNEAGDGYAVLEHLGAELQSSEYAMELILDDTAFSASLPDFSLKPCSQSSEEVTLRLFQNGSLFLGSCCLSPAGKDCCCLHHVEISESYRGQGFGSVMMALLRSYLSSQNIRRLTLQVSGDNAPALALYKKTGFRITETLSYYLY